jgi:hypothetical protein
MGTGLFLMAVEFSGEGFAGIRYLGPFSLVVQLLWVLVVVLVNKRKDGTIINYENSNFFNKEGKF